VYVRTWVHEGRAKASVCRCPGHGSGPVRRQRHVRSVTSKRQQWKEGTRAASTAATPARTTSSARWPAFRRRRVCAAVRAGNDIQTSHERTRLFPTTAQRSRHSTGGRGAHLGCGSSDQTVGKACGGTEQPGASGCRTGAALSSIGPTHPRSASDLRGGRRPWHVQHRSLLPLLFFFCLPHSQRNGGLGEMSASRYPRYGQRHGALGGGPVFLPVLSSSLLVIAGRACGGLGKIPPRWRCRTGRATVGGFL
jgi:hypothetical protein